MKHVKDAAKAVKIKAVNAVLDKIAFVSSKYPEGADLEPTNKDLDLQLACQWHCRAEGPLPKGIKSAIPKVSKLTTKSLKRDALVAALSHFLVNSETSNGQGEVLEEEQVEEDVDSDVDMELDYNRFGFLGLRYILREERSPLPLHHHLQKEKTDNDEPGLRRSELSSGA
ncbi:hypothetical protein B0H13DRAFT_1909605 [Mycena leptocephala]|nr:hypothetical protein B0H13DRAFT_1909605 [Mycena leptocephala]